MIHLDTHVVVWLYYGRSELISDKAKKLIEVNDLSISPMVSLELEYLHEAGKVSVGSKEILRDLEMRVGLVLASESFELISEAAIEQSWTRDPFDRLLVAQAIIGNARLVTKDRSILRHFGKAMW
ncbi:MAG: PIN domain-containing protein [Deltaproteobacteria bacterium]|nr:PIN domain-containing protein [Deltaproteobacteria bacterium]MBI3294176.1 PIN domain-containing protein [Deltaproteobacteria bacterium]